MHPLKQYLADVQESVADFGVRVGASRQTLYRIINGRQSPKPALARRIVEATGGAVMFDALFPRPESKGEGRGEIAPLMMREGAELDHQRLKVALAAVVHHLTAQQAPDPSDRTIEIAAEAAANTYAALRPVTTRQGPDRLTQALRPVLEEILRECADPVPPPGALDRGAQLATDLYYQSWQFEGVR
jgi:DNA-binding XRE family transcriptional regulator